MKSLHPHLYPVDPPPEALHVRSFNDDQHARWQAAVMEASFGNSLLILSRIGGEGVRVMTVDAANFGEAEQWLATVDDDGLRRCLAEAKPYP